MEERYFPCSLRYERVVLSAVLRVVPVTIGAAIALSFGASVLHDPEDLAHSAWHAGGQIFFIYADLVRALVIPGLTLLGIARLVDDQQAHVVRVSSQEIVFRTNASRRTIALQNSMIASVGWKPDKQHTQVLMELREGLGPLGVTGDTLIITVPNSEVEGLRRLMDDLPLHAQGKGDSPPIRWGRGAVSFALGTLLAHPIYKLLTDTIASLPRPSSYVPIVANAAQGWYWGLLITCIGLMFALTRWLTRPRRLDVRDRCVVVERWISSQRIHFDDIETVVALDRGVRIVTAQDDVIHFRAASPMAAQALAADLQQRLITDSPTPDIPAALIRGVAPVASWRKRIATSANVTSYRHREFDSDNLVACLEAPHASRDVRVGAALALAARANREDQQRLRDAAQQTRNATLKNLYQQLADGEAEQVDVEAALAPSATRRYLLR